MAKGVYERSAETRRKMSESRKGRPLRADAPQKRRGAEHRSWKGGRRVDSCGYVLLYVGHDHPMANCKGYAYEHRLVVSGLIGRSLTANETVHHVNGDKADNRLENLQLRQGRHGRGVSYMCGDCGSINVLSVEL